MTKTLERTASRRGEEMARPQATHSRTCTKCCDTKPLSAFSGKKRLCKRCDADRARDAYWTDPDLSREQRRHAYWKDHEKSKQRQRERYWRNVETNRKRGRAFATSDRGRALNRKAVARYQAANPEKVRAQRIAQAAARRGEVMRSQVCEVVGCERRDGLHFHHTNYRRPLDVVTVCHLHHEAVHHIAPQPLRNGKKARPPRQPKPRAAA